MAANPLNIYHLQYLYQQQQQKKTYANCLRFTPQTVSLAFLKLYELLHDSGQYHDSLLPAATSPKLLF